MRLQNLKIGTRLFSLVVIASIFLVGIGLFSIASVARVDERFTSQLARDSDIKRSIDLARSAQVAFKIQVQEWKNVLIRGNDSEKYKKYFESFHKEHASVQDKLRELQALMARLGMNPENAQLAAKAHAELLEKYQGALKQFDPGDENTGKKVDKLVTGIDRAPTEAVDRVVDGILAATEDMHHQAEAQARASYQETKQVFLAGIALALFVMVAVSLAIIRSITAPLRRTVHFSEAVAQGQLEATLDVDGDSETGLLADGLRQMVANLKAKIAEAEAKGVQASQETERASAATREAREALEKARTARQEGMLHAADKLQGVVGAVTDASAELSSQIEQSSQGADQQAGRVGETATAMEEMTATVLEVARNASEASSTAGQARVKAQEGASVVSQVVQGISEVQRQALSLKTDMVSLGEQAEGIGKIMGVISDIADQTNLLALNAAIEAARAGDAGRGFAVVADEVRKLAEKTMTATKEVDQSVRGIQQSAQKNMENVDQAVATIDQATTLADQSGQALREIVAMVELTTDQVRSIATAAEEQSSTSEEINRSIEDVSRISSETSSAMRESAQVVSRLAEQARSLRDLIQEMQDSCV